MKKARPESVEIGERAVVGSIVVTRVMGGNVELSTRHSPPAGSHHIERADIKDAIEALRIAAGWPW